MKRLPSVVSALCATLLSCSIAPGQQKELSPARPTGEVVLITLAKPLYPPLARQANIVGDVDISVTVRPDGTAQSADVLRGHPMLKQAALESATHSQFECRGCSAPMQYLFLYSYRLNDDGDCCEGYAVTPTVEQQAPTQDGEGRPQTHVNITAKQGCICDPAADITKKVRSSKCLYLWKCGTAQ